jgi:predicted ribosome quality control (RQC) complex YloA/Tae2 family protein
VRNPQRKPALPERTVLEAAAIAAWYSKGRDEKHVDVHVAWRRHVRKGKGMPSGMVMLKKFRSVRVRPQLPEGADPLR